MTALAIVRWNVCSYGSDTGTFAQAVSNAFSGFTDGTEGGTHFRFHFSPVLAVLWPLTALTHSPFSLQIAQVVLIALTALPLAALMSGYAAGPWPARCAVLAAVYPPLLANAFSEFHELAFYPVVAIALIWAADRAKWGWFTLFAVIAAIIREDVCLDLIIIGVVLAIVGLARRDTQQRGLLLGEPREPRRLMLAGIGLALLSAASLAVYVAAILPRIGPWMPSHYYEYPFAHGPLQTALAAFTHPLQLARAIATTGRLTYLLEALVPLALLPLFTRWSLLALPAYAGILLSSDQSVWRMGMHYALLWVPWLLLGASWALVQRVRAGAQRSARRWWSGAVAICAVFLIAFNPMHPVHYLQTQPYQHTRDLLAVLRCIPKNARVQMHDEWYAREALAYPGSSPFAARQLAGNYLLFASDWQSAPFERLLPKIRAAQRAGVYVEVCRSGSVHVLRARSDDAGTS